MGKTGSERVQAWRLRHLREFYRTEVLLSREDAAILDRLCEKTGWSRSEMIREMIRRVKLSG